MLGEAASGNVASGSLASPVDASGGAVVAAADVPAAAAASGFNQLSGAGGAGGHEAVVGWVLGLRLRGLDREEGGVRGEPSSSRMLSSDGGSASAGPRFFLKYCWTR
eukprot:10629222-Alexandrium_andersonii.AAC.1